jgi:hypothetical protein
MAENQQIRAGGVQCWACGAVVNKDAKTCPKCGAEAPAFSTDKLRKAARIGLCVGIPVGILSLIAAIAMFMNGMEEVSFFLGPGIAIAATLFL